MPNKNYIKGRRFEYKIRDYFKNRGYTVIRSAGSHSEIDLIAFNKTFCYILQLKNSQLSKNARLRLHSALAGHTGYKFMKPIILSKDWEEEIRRAI